MEANIKVGQAVQVRLNDLTPYPQNPRRGDIQAIAESLSFHGQFKPIVVNKKNNVILAGNHTFKAAKKLGWKQISAVYVDVDPVEARRIMLADNRINDLASYNEGLLETILKTFDDLNGTGFNEGDIKALERIINDGEEPKSDKQASDKLQDDPEVKISAWHFTITPIAYSAWKDHLANEAEQSKPKAINLIRQRLGIPKPQIVKKENPSNPSTPDNFVKCETVQISNLKPYPVNPREGDIGAIIESLQTNGQYRPIVANKRTGHILTGNHTFEGAKALGWFEIAVSWVDVDEDQELKIVLVDNRTSDLATYDTNELKNHLINSAGQFKGTGFQPEDASEILSGGQSKPGNQPIGRTTCKVGEYKFRASTEELNNWANKIENWQNVAELLIMPLEACNEYQQGYN
jgi:ParB-like chromosome segregation protein Spo0J